MTATDQQADRDYYTTSEVLAFVGCTYKFLDYAIRAGYLPIANPTPGNGVPRIFTSDEIDILHAAHYLVRTAQIAPKAAFAIAHQLADDGRYELRFGGIYRIRIDVIDTPTPATEETP